MAPASEKSVSVVRRSKLYWLPWLIGLATLIPWWVVREGPYHFDDWSTPVSDPASQSLSAWLEYVVRTLRPLSKLSFAIESSLGWADLPSLRRADSAIVMSLGAVALFTLLVRLRMGRLAAAALAVLYGIHPLHAEEVLSLSGRSSEMASLLILICLVLLEQRRDGASAVAFVAACFSRETAVFGIIPVLVLAVSRDGIALALFRRLEWHIAIVLGFISYLIWHHRYRDLADYSFHARPYVPTIARQIGAIPTGLSLWLRPAAMSIDHGEDFSSSWWSPATLGGLGILAIAIYIVASFAFSRSMKSEEIEQGDRETGRAGGNGAQRFRDRRAVAVGASLFLGALLPTQTLMPKIDPLTERPFAFALAGVLVMLAPLAKRALRAHILVSAATTALGLMLVLATLKRGELYRSDLALWGDAAEKSLTNPRPHYNYALALLDGGRLDEARSEVEAAKKIDPFDMQIENLLRRIVDAHVESSDP